MGQGVINFDEAHTWIEQGTSIHLKAASRCGDPIELTAHEARDIAYALLRLADDLDGPSGEQKSPSEPDASDYAHESPRHQ